MRSFGTNGTGGIERVRINRESIMLRSSLFIAVAAALGILASGPVLAQTPDGETPATETICDSLLGGTPGLYGLCVAYCEAQDFDEMLQQAKAGGVPGEKVLARYRSKMMPGDPDMPCIVSASACPCHNFDVCTTSSGTACGLDILDVSGLFAGHTCDLRDECNNSPGLASDFCTSAGEPSATVANAIVFSDGSGGLCNNRTPNGVGGQIGNIAIMDGPTARVCLDELNAYDGNGEDAGQVLMCGLSN